MTLEELKKQRALNLSNNKKQNNTLLNEFDENKGVLAQALSNVDESGLQLLKDITTPIFHPIQTAKDLKSLGSSVINLILPGEQGNEQLAKEVGNFFKERYGGLNNIKKTFATDPLGMLSDISIIFSGGSMLPGKVGKISNLASKVDPIYATVQAAKVPKFVAGKTIAPILGMTTGAGETAISTAFKSGQKGGKVGLDFRKNITGNEKLTQVVEETLESLKENKAKTSKNYLEGKKELNLGSKRINPDKVAKSVDKLVDSKKINGFNQLSGKAQTKVKNIKKIIEEWRINPKNHTLEGLDALKRRIDAEYPQGLKPGDEGRIVSDIRNNIKDFITKESPDYAKVMNAYEEAITLEKQLMNELSLNKRSNVGTTLRKLQSVMRNNVNTNFGNRLEALKFLDSKDGNLMAKLAGQSLNTWTPRGIQSIVPSSAMAVGTTALAGGGVINPLTLIPSLAMGSPRLMGELAYGAGVTSRPVAAASNLINKLPHPVKTAIRPSNLLRTSRAAGLLDRPIQENRGLLQ
jgi:hypothetical protein